MIRVRDLACFVLGPEDGCVAHLSQSPQKHKHGRPSVKCEMKSLASRDDSRPLLLFGNSIPAEIQVT